MDKLSKDKITKCDFCAESTSKYTYCNKFCGYEGSDVCREATERFTRYMIAVAKSNTNTKTVNRNININHNKRRNNRRKNNNT